MDARPQKLLELLKYRVTNQSGNIPRELFLFCICACMAASKEKPEVLKFLGTVNDAFPEPLGEKEWQGYMSTCLRKKYRITNAKIIQMLDITEEEQEKIGLRPAKEKHAKKKTARPRTCADADAMERDFSAGMTIQEIAEKYKRTVTRVYQIFAKRGILTTKEQERLLILKLLKQGMTPVWIIEHYGIKRRRDRAGTVICQSTF